MWIGNNLSNLSADVFADDNGYDYIIVATTYNNDNEDRNDYGLYLNLMYFDDSNTLQSKRQWVRSIPSANNV